MNCAEVTYALSHGLNNIFGKGAFSMSKKKPPARHSLLRRVTLALYIAAVAVSLVVVVSFVALKLFAPAPKVPGQVEFPLATDGPQQSGALNTADVTGIDQPHKVTLNRRRGVYTCLLLGVADQGGSDTIMLGVFDTGRKTASLISIPRDTVVYYNGMYQKINAAYADGPEGVAQCVKEMLAVPIDYYVAVNFRAFREIVNEIGGVWFDVPPGMDYEDPTQDLYIHLAPGYQQLNGDDALKLVRCRSAYASQDIGRAATQRAFLAALAKQTITLSNVTKVTSLIGILNTYVDSDMPLNDMVYFGTQAVGMDLDTALTSAVLSSNWIDPYIIPGEDEVLELVNSLGIYEEEVPAAVLRLAHPW